MASRHSKFYAGAMEMPHVAMNNCGLERYVITSTVGFFFFFLMKSLNLFSFAQGKIALPKKVWRAKETLLTFSLQSSSMLTCFLYGVSRVWISSYTSGLLRSTSKCGVRPEKFLARFQKNLTRETLWLALSRRTLRTLSRKFSLSVGEIRKKYSKNSLVLLSSCWASLPNAVLSRYRNTHKLAQIFA